jgi:hypothetical protein
MSILDDDLNTPKPKASRPLWHIFVLILVFLVIYLGGFYIGDEILNWDRDTTVFSLLLITALFGGYLKRFFEELVQ